MPNISLTLNGNLISRVHVTKYLGMYLDEQLSWTHHVEYVINKLVKLRGAFYYIANVVDEHCIRQIYHAYVFPYIEYGIEVYGACGDTVMKKLQIEQNKLLQILYKKERRYETNKLYHEIKLLKCIDIYKFFIGLLVYKQQHNILPVIFADYYKVNSDINTRCTRQSKDLHIPLLRTKGGQKSLKYIGAKIWNNISNEIKEKSSMYSFKKLLRNELIRSYCN